MEMAAAKVPMLLSDDTSLAEPYGAVAWFAPLPINDTQWIDGISQLLTNPAQKTRYVNAARALALTHTWKSIAAQWDALLETA
jgi:glycosyltransferase involved in cell wall biosynthesis